MILRNLAEALRNQNWFTVVLEIMIVVIGIFLGLQANDWNQGRKDRALEVRYLERLQADLEKDLGRLESSEYFANLRMRQVRLLLDGIADPAAAAAQPDQFIEAVEKVSWESYRRITSNTYSELIGAGRATLIRSENLRDALAEYYADIEFWETILKEEFLAREYSVAMAGLLSLNFLERIAQSGPPSEPIDLAVEAGDAVAIAIALKSRAQGIQLLPMIYKHHYTVLVANAEVRNQNEALQAAIEEYLMTMSGST
ncbi:MAG: hypothetical protein GTN98_11270 [Woeseiaceae bacterium]|nr:hypothetical protein [Woeseiaceae bacterium]